MTRMLAPALLALLLALPPAAEADGDPEKGKTVFKKCMACHMIGPDAVSKVGPPLNGIVGRKAGIWQDYSYSDVNKDSGVVWDEATLTIYLKSPKAMLPGTKMAFVGLKKDDEITNVIAYLKAFDADGYPIPPP